MHSISERKQINPLAAAIREEIRRAGVIPFARFMELALYHPDHGYYRRNDFIIGKKGDFFTSVSVGNLFGEMIAFWLAREMSGIDGPLQLVEAGAHDGVLARDVLSWLNRCRPELAARMEYWIIEPSRILEDRQRELLKGFGAARWFNDLEAAPAVRGAFVSNELLDAFPVHVFRWNRRWCEMGVGCSSEEFVWQPMPELSEWSSKALAELAPLEPFLPPEFTVEFSPAAEEWWRKAAMKLEAGLMLTIDYGGEAQELWSPARARGTVRSFENHRLVENPLANPGGQDITASVNFTRIRSAGETAGLKSEPLQAQSAFFTKLAGDFFSEGPTGSEARQFQTLTHPDHLGRAFKVCIQRR